MVRALGLAEIATWIRHHHERWDGEGYPDGLVGERIPLPSRIVGVADAMDAMTTARAYREALSLERATQELLEHAGTQFDPAGCRLPGRVAQRRNPEPVRGASGRDLIRDLQRRPRRARPRGPPANSPGAVRGRRAQARRRSDDLRRVAGLKPAAQSPVASSIANQATLHVDPRPSERDPLGFEQPPLTRPLGQGPVRAHDPLPRNVGVLAGRHHSAREAWRGGTQVAVGGHEAGGNRADTPQHLTGAGGVEHPGSEYGLEPHTAGRVKDCVPIRHKILHSTGPSAAIGASPYWPIRSSSRRRAAAYAASEYAGSAAPRSGSASASSSIVAAACERTTTTATTIATATAAAPIR